MDSEREQTIIEKIKRQKEINEQLRGDTPHEQDNIPNLFSCLTSEEFDYIVNNPQFLKQLKRLG